MSKLGYTLFLLSSLVFAHTTSAAEVKPGNVYSGTEVFQVLSKKAYNLVDPQCIQKTVFQSPQHQAHIAIGSNLKRLIFRACTNAQTGADCLATQATYIYAAEQVEDTVIFDGICDLQN
jgi:hypothetical protein